MTTSIRYHQLARLAGALRPPVQLHELARAAGRRVWACAARGRLHHLLLLLAAPAAAAQTTTFGYNGTAQSYTVPAGTYSIAVVAAGGAGGTGTGSVAVAGAQVKATLTVVPGEVLAVRIGGAGAAGVMSGMATGGYNGGAIGNNNQGGGGGATDLRRTSGTRTSDYLASRNALLVAAGGGGGGGGVSGGAAGMHLTNGGDGSGVSGGYGATQTAAGAGGDLLSAVGVGAPGNTGNGGSGGTFGLFSLGGGGGGGGYYGGGGGSSNLLLTAGGGGGSSWVMLAGSTAFSSLTAATTAAGEMSITAIQVPLPVVLVRFTAVAVGPDAVNLAWATASELNCASFAVERSTDGRAFLPLTTLPGAGTSSSARAYAWVDARLPARYETLYYRLRQTDLDATVTFSPVRTVGPPAARIAPQLQAYPNPAHGTISVRVLGPLAAGPAPTYQVFDAHGRLVRLQAVADAGTEALLPLTGLPAGLYLLRCGSLVQPVAVE